MFRRKYFSFLKDPTWVKILSLATTLFFIFLADAILSFWVPNFLEAIYTDQAKVGLIIAFQSVVGLLADLILPQIIHGVTVRKLTLMGIVLTLIFGVFLLQLTWTPILLLVFSSMAIWGVYYELFGFAQQQFVADSTPISFHPASWAILGVFKSLAYMVGPLISGALYFTDIRFPLVVALIFSSIGLFLIIFHSKYHDRPLEIDIREVNFFREISHWAVLFRVVWPIIIMTLFLGLIDATFWMVGAIWSVTLAKENILGSLFIPLYMLPSIYMGFLVAKWGVFSGKKRKAIIYFIFAGLFLSLLGIWRNVYWQLVMVLVSSTLLSVTYPLIDAVYSDIVARMGRHRKHLIGVSSSTVNMAYIIGTPVAGLIAKVVGEPVSFSIMGLAAVLVGLFLLLVTPRKLRLPQSEIERWED